MGYAIWVLFKAFAWIFVTLAKVCFWLIFALFMLPIWLVKSVAK